MDPVAPDPNPEHWRSSGKSSGKCSDFSNGGCHSAGVQLVIVNARIPECLKNDSGFGIFTGRVVHCISPASWSVRYRRSRISLALPSYGMLNTGYHFVGTIQNMVPVSLYFFSLFFVDRLSDNSNCSYLKLNL